MSKHRSLVVVVNGTPCTIKVFLNTKLKDVKRKALVETYNEGRPDSDWVMISDNKTLTDDTLVGQIDYHTELFMSLKAGGGGSIRKRERDKGFA